MPGNAGPVLEGRWTLEQSIAGVQRNVNGDYDAIWLQLTEEYRAHVITTIPGGVRR